jgi:hypothetical protein
MNTKTIITVTLVAALILSIQMASATPIPGQVLKFQQEPLDGRVINGVEYWGHDELSTALSNYTQVAGAEPVLTGYRGVFMADDFADRFDSPVVHVRWWGSYLNNERIQPVDKFLIAFESDIPDPDGQTGPLFSQPGSVLLPQVVDRGPIAPGSGTFEEKWVSPGGDPLLEELYEYNAELHVGKEFFQKPDTVYWLKIVALVDVGPDWDPATQPATQWGWHNRDYTVMDPLASVPPAVVPGEHIQGVIDSADGTTTPIWHFQDDAVTGLLNVDITVDPIMPFVEQDQTTFEPTHYLDLIDGPDGISNYSKDLAFELYTVPEPATLVILSLGAVLLRKTRRV